MKKSTANLLDMLVSELIPDRVFDERAETILEIARKKNLSPRDAQRRMDALLAEDKVERVWKKGRIRPVPAWRIKKA